MTELKSNIGLERYGTVSKSILFKDNLRIDKDQINEPPYAVLAGISREKGHELFMIFNKSVNIEKF